MKKVLISVMVVICLFGASACSLFEAEDKTFSGAGMTITLNDSFKKTEALQAQFIVQSTETIFMGNGQSKSGFSDLENYTRAVLSTGGKTAQIYEYNEDGVRFWYAYYTSTVEGSTYGYMLITKEGDSKYYAMNLGCYESKLENKKSQYMKWAKTIIVE